MTFNSSVYVSVRAAAAKSSPGLGVIHIDNDRDDALCGAVPISIDGITSVNSRRRATCVECCEIADYLVEPIGSKEIRPGHFITWEKEKPKPFWSGGHP